MIFTVPDYRPPSLNTLLRMHWGKRHKLKQEAYELVAAYWLKAEHPAAVGKRSVRITLVSKDRRNRPDGDNILKLLLDALVRCRALLDDGPDWCRVLPVEHASGPRREVRFELEDEDDG